MVSLRSLGNKIIQKCDELITIKVRVGATLGGRKELSLRRGTHGLLALPFSIWVLIYQSGPLVSMHYSVYLSSAVFYIYFKYN